MNKHQLTLAVVQWKGVYLPEQWLQGNELRRSNVHGLMMAAFVNPYWPARFLKKEKKK